MARRIRSSQKRVDLMWVFRPPRNPYPLPQSEQWKWNAAPLAIVATMILIFLCFFTKIGH